MVITLIMLVGGTWRCSNGFNYYYLSDIQRYAACVLDSNNFQLGSTIYNNANTTIDCIFKSDPSYTNNNSTYNYILGFGKTPYDTSQNYNVRDAYITSNLNIEKSFIDLSRSNGDSAFVRYYINLKDGIYHHYACTIKNNSLFKVYLDGKKILEYTRGFGSDSIFAIHISANWNGTIPSVCILNYRVSKGLRWTENFDGQTPMDDIRWTIKENNDNMYGVKKG